MITNEMSEVVLAVELEQELLALANDLQRHTRQVAYYNYNEGYPDLHQEAKDNLIRAEEMLRDRIRDICRLPRNEVYRCLAEERAQAVAMQAAHAQAITQVFSAMADRMEKMRQEYAAKIRELEAK